MMQSFGYVRAGSTGEALDLLGKPGSRVHAGGTDLLGCLRDGALKADTLVSISGIDELRGISEIRDGGLRIGTLTTIAEVAASPLVAKRYAGLAQAAIAVGSPQIRHQGTLGGNLCQRPRCWYFRGDFDCATKGGGLCYAVDGENRRHAIFGGGPCFKVHPSDTAPMLMALGASVRIAGPDGERILGLKEFFVLPDSDLERETVLGDDELLTEVILPAPARGLVSSYRKVRERGAWDFALTSVALAVRMVGRRADAARIVLGGVAPVPWRVQAAERALVGRDVDDKTARLVSATAVKDAEPLDQNDYKVRLVRGVLEASLLTL